MGKPEGGLVYVAPGKSVDDSPHMHPRNSVDFCDFVNRHLQFTEFSNMANVGGPQTTLRKGFASGVKSSAFLSPHTEVSL